MKKVIIPVRVERKLPVFAMIIVFMIIFIVSIQNVHAQSTYYVGGTDASDSNPGTSSQPFATIQKAATVATAGSTVNIRTGTYRETVTPANSNVTYQPDQGATVVISGLNAADGDWTVHSGNIYKKTITLNGNNQNLSTITSNTTLLANQVFKGGDMMFEARWPKVGTVADLLDRTKLRQRNSTSNWAQTSITDADIPDIVGGWNGGRIWISGWYVAHTANITSHNGTTIGFNSGWGDMRYHQYYYLTGKLAALTQAKEWFYESNTLYFWQEGGGSPTGVEYKARNWGFDLRGKSNITINGLQFIGCDPVNADINSSNTIVDGIKAKYINHAFLLTGGGDLYTNARQTGLMIIGPNSILRNSEIQHAASQAVWLGSNCRMENNLVIDINYEGNYAAGVNFWNPGTSGQVVTRNTFARMGRSAIDFSEYESRYPVGKQTHLNMDISYNDIYGSLMLSSDGGQMYGSVYTDLTGTRIHHNWIHDSKAQKTPSAEHEVGVATGLYFDQASGPTTCDHNVLWNNYQCDIHNASWSEKRAAGKSYIYNNVLATDAGDNHTGTRSYLTTTTQYFDVMRNNIFRDDVVINWQATTNTTAWGDMRNCLTETQHPKFVYEGHGGLKGRLKPESPGIDTGVEIPGITEGSVGTPDIGAYEHGGTEWVPGYSAEGYVPDYYATELPWQEEPTPPIVNPPAPGTIEVDDAETGTGENQYEFVGTWGTSTPDAAYMKTDHYSNEADAYYQVRFTGTKVEVYGEKNSSFSIVAISVDGGEEILVDCYDADRIVNTLLYKSSELPIGSHTVKVRLTGTKNDTSTGTWHTADRVIITTGTLTIDDTDIGTGKNQYEFVGTSWQASQAAGTYMETDHYSGKTDDYYQVRFTGTQIKLYGEKNPSFCIVAISIDGGEETLLDCYNAVQMRNTLLYTSPVLTDGSHIVKVRLTGTKNASSTSFWHTADRAEIFSGGATGIADLLNTKKYSVYPNPGNGRFSLKSKNNTIKAIEIYNGSGGKIYSLNNINRDNQEINITAFAEGIYFVKLFDGEEHFTEKLIIRKD